jgi:hypothetical protein
VSCTKASNCVAVGIFTNASDNVQTLFESWNGTVWSITPSPNPYSGDNSVFGVSCSNSASCVAVGVAYEGYFQTLTLISSTPARRLQASRLLPGGSGPP